MNTAQTHRPRLDRWLTRTTAMLCDDAKETVRREIEGHVAEAVERYTDEGMSEREAWDAAIGDLGSPAEAARGFHKTHLTPGEFFELHPDPDAIGKWGKRIERILLSLIGIAILAWWSWSTSAILGYEGALFQNMDRILDWLWVSALVKSWFDWLCYRSPVVLQLRLTPQQRCQLMLATGFLNFVFALSVLILGLAFTGNVASINANMPPSLTFIDFAFLGFLWGAIGLSDIYLYWRLYTKYKACEA